MSRGLLGCALMWVSGCAIAPDDPKPARAEDIVSYLMQQALPTGGVEVVPPQPIAIEEARAFPIGALPDVRGRAWPADAGWMGFVNLQGATQLFRTGQDGALRLLGPYDDEALAHVAESCFDVRLSSGDWLLLPCALSQVAERRPVWVRADAQALEVVSGFANQPEHIAVGESDAVEHFALAKVVSAGEVTVEHWQVRQGDAGLSVQQVEVTTLPLPAGAERVHWVRRRAASGWEVVVSDGVQSWAFVTEAGVQQQEALGLWPSRVVLTQDGALVIDQTESSSRVVTWRIYDDGAVQAVAIPEAPSGAGWPGAWRSGWANSYFAYRVAAHPDYGDDYPIVAQASRVLMGDGVAGVAALPTMPCRDVEQCFRIGESRPVAIVGAWGLYLMFGWHGPSGVYAIPLPDAAIDSE